jgi:hypothetical protein
MCFFECNLYLKAAPFWALAVDSWLSLALKAPSSSLAPPAAMMTAIFPLAMLRTSCCN